MFTFYEEPSPLTYHTSSAVERFGLVMPDLVDVPFRPNDVYFAETYRTIKKGANGRLLKQPRIETIPGARPGTVGYVDWHMMMPEYAYIDFMKVRMDWRQHGAGTQLVDEFYKHVLVAKRIPNVHWGKVVSEFAWKIYEKMQRKYPQIHHSGHRDF